MKNFEKVKYIEIVLENCEVIRINIEHIKFLSVSGITFNDFSICILMAKKELKEILVASI